MPRKAKNRVTMLMLHGPKVEQTLKKGLRAMNLRVTPVAPGPQMPMGSSSCPGINWAAVEYVGGSGTTAKRLESIATKLEELIGPPPPKSDPAKKPPR